MAPLPELRWRLENRGQSADSASLVRAAPAPLSLLIHRSSHSETVGESVRLPVTRSTVSKTISRILAWSKFPAAARSAVFCQASKISLASDRLRFFVDFRTH